MGNRATDGSSRTLTLAGRVCCDLKGKGQTNSEGRTSIKSGSCDRLLGQHSPEPPSAITSRSFAKR